MIYLRTITLKSSGSAQTSFPFTVPVIKTMDKIEFKSPVTIFVGENGTGKSTLLEAIAAGFGSISVGSTEIDQDNSLLHARALGKQLRFVRNKHPRRGFFLELRIFLDLRRRLPLMDSI